VSKVLVDSTKAAISPAVQRIIEGWLFDLDGDHFWIDRHFKHGHDPARDVLVLRGVEYMRCDQREVCRAVQVRDVEAWIEQDRIDFAFGPTALALNLALGWGAPCRGTEGVDELRFIKHMSRPIVIPARH